MSTNDADASALTVSNSYQLVYERMHVGSCLAFPCNEAGTVDLNDLTARVRDNYLLARALVGRDFYPPSVVNLQAGTVAPRSRP